MARPALAALLLAAGLPGLGAGRAAALEVAQFGDAGFLRVDYQLQARVGERNQGLDPGVAQTTYDYYVRRNRLSFIGAADETFGAVVQLELNGGQRLGDTTVLDPRRKFELVLLDAFLNVDPTSFLRLRAGKTKHVLTREVQEGCFDPLSIDRSPFIIGPFSLRSAELTTRDVGLVLWGNLLQDVVQYRLAAMQGNRFGDTAPGGIGFRYTGRVHATFLDKEASLVYRGTYLGRKRVLTLGAGLELQRKAVRSSLAWGGAEDYLAYTYDLFYEQPTRYGTFTLSGAYLRADFGEAGLRGVADAQGTTGERSGFYWKAGYMLGPLQLFARWERWAFADLNGVPDQRLRWLVSGLNWFVKGEDLRFTLEYAATHFQRPPAADFHTVLFQVQAQL